MAQTWTIDGPRVIDVGDDGEHVARLEVSLVGGDLDVVTHGDSPTARVEVHAVEGAPLQVDWDGTRLRIVHLPVGSTLAELWGSRGAAGFFGFLGAKLSGIDKHRARLSISVPVECEVRIRTVSASALVSGVANSVSVGTVSGSMSLDDLRGAVDVNTVSGEVECRGIEGNLKVNAVSGGVTAQSSDLSSVRINTISGDVALDLTNPAAEIASTSVSGNVTVRAPYAGFDVSATSASGQVVAGGQSSSARAHRDRSKHLREGDGGMRIRATAVSGDVVLLKGTVAGREGSR
ncbi:conserved hypothetical protein [Nostocoides japonicum T1-X7]|uniref:DUF4097 domain-containing protein n=1 Tax=Nostocoides japonicum T1-X7 TaxID=1194083 RepID=A0A077LX70_9MICO|nr:DUF4097 family beta strand repeat-containing protein [Tetrasphaera japonica]CCH78271.1 conserved hypothetical protein [Tetrasphaera japonica T1-X7]